MRRPLAANHLADVLAHHPRAPRYWIAFSGGLDSTVLAHLCRALAERDASFDFAAAHIHHGLHPAADAWVRHVHESAHALKLSLEVRHVDGRPKAGESPEAAARIARYTALTTLVNPGEVLLTAQHQDDQAESVLLQLFRGAGLAGLAAMPAWTSFGQGFLGRPLLDLPRSALEDYAVRNRLNWIDDPGNTDRRFDRNYLRHDILPRLRNRWPSLAETLSRSARHCAEADRLLTELGTELLARVRHPTRNTLQIEPLLALSPARQQLILRLWIRKVGLRPLPSVLIGRTLNEVAPARRDRNPEVTWHEGTIRRHRGELHLLRPRPPFDRRQSVVWARSDVLVLPNENGALTARLECGPGIAPQQWSNARIEVRYRRGGETLSLPRRQGTRTLKKLLQQSDLPPWLRERAPLIYINETLAAVADLCIAAPFAGDPGNANIRIDWQQPVFSATLPCIDDQDPLDETTA